MARFIALRTAWAIPVLLIVTFLTFWAVKSATDPVQSYLRINTRATPEMVEEYKEKHGLVGSTPEQYFRWLGNFVTLEWGNSIKGNRPGVSRPQGGDRQHPGTGAHRHCRWDDDRHRHRHPLRIASVLETRHRRHRRRLHRDIACRHSCPRSCCRSFSQSCSRRWLGPRRALPTGGRGLSARSDRVRSGVEDEAHDPPGDGGRDPDHRHIQPVHAGLAARRQGVRVHADGPGQRDLREAGDRQARPAQFDGARWSLLEHSSLEPSWAA